MDKKNGDDSVPIGVETGENTHHDPDPVAINTSHTSRKNNTEATQSGSGSPRGNDRTALEATNATDSSSPQTPKAPLPPPVVSVAHDVLVRKKTGAETSTSNVKTSPGEATPAVKTSTEIRISNTTFKPAESIHTVRKIPSNGGNHQSMVDGNKEPLVKASNPVPAAQATNPTNQPQQPSSTSAEPKSLCNAKIVSFNMNLSTSSAGIRDPGLQQSSGSAPPQPLPKPFPVPHKQSKSQGTHPVPAKSTTLASASASADSSPPLKPAAPVPEPSIDETIKILRAPLVDTYAPFIAPNDSSLSSARERLRTALDETRILRAAFTDRVYDKYKVLLRPVPKSVDSIIEKIKADPAGVSLKLQEEIRMVKKEKDIEKKEAQKLHAHAVASAAGEGTPLSPAVNTQETVEQLAWYGAGLNIVVLPEDEIGGDIDQREYPHRGPTNPETGQRVGGISAAAAAAAEGLLDRVRRGGAIRMERQRMRQLKLLSGEDTEREADSSAYFTHLLSSSTLARTSQGITTPSSAAKGKSSKRGSGGSIGGAGYGSGSKGRGRSQTTLSGSTLLSLNPQTEELNPQAGESTAATAALISKGVGSSSNSKTVQQRWRHPHPESSGGRRLALTAQSSSKKLDSARGLVPGINPMPMSAYLALALPPFPTAKERKEKQPVQVLETGKAATERGKRVVHSVLQQFFCNEPGRESKPQQPKHKDHPDIGVVEKWDKQDSPDCTKGDTKSKNAPSDSTPRLKRKKRRVTEIGLLRGMQDIRETPEAPPSEALRDHNTAAGERDGPTDFSVVDKTTDSGKDTGSNVRGKPPIDPILAFSVLNALGVVHEVTKSSQPQYSNFLSRLMEFRSSVNEADIATANPKPNDGSAESDGKPTPQIVIRRLVSRKRRFSEAFSNDSFSGHLGEEELDTYSGKPADEIMSDANEASQVLQQPEEKNLDKLDPPDTQLQPSESSGINEIPGAQKSLIASIRGGGEAILSTLDINIEKPSVSTCKKDLGDDGSVTVPSIRGGGEALPNSPSEGSTAEDEDAVMSQRPSSAKKAKKQRNRDWGDESNQSMSVLNSRLTALSRSTSSPSTFSPQRSTTASGGRLPRPLPSGSPIRSLSHGITGNNERFRHSQLPPVPLSHASLHQQAAASIGRPMSHGEMPEYFGGMHQSPQPSGAFATAQTEWSSLGAAAAGLLPTHSSLAALGLNSHRAAVVSLQVRERAASVLLAREQARAAAAQRHAAAVRGGAGMSALSPHQAAALMGSPAGQASSSMYRTATNTFAQRGSCSVSSGRLISNPGTSPSIGVNTKAAGSGPSSDVQKKKPPQESRATRPPEDNRKSRDPEEMGIGNPETAQNKARQDVGLKRSNSAGGGQTKRTRTDSPSKEDSEELSRSNVRRTMSDPTHSKPPSKYSESPVDVALAETPNTPFDGDSHVPPATTGASNQAPQSVANPSKESKLKTPNAKSAILLEEQEEESVPVLTTGMTFFVPIRPNALTEEVTNHILSSRIHVAARQVSRLNQNQQDERPSASFIEYLVAVGSAVPIPKALVSNPLKERLNTPGFKSPGNSGSLAIPRDVVVATILVWLWAEHKASFQRAFAKRGRIDVDPECKWLVLAAVDAAVRALMLEIADSVARGGQLASTLSGNRNRSSSGLPKGQLKGAEAEGDKPTGVPTTLGIQVACIVSEALMTELCIDEDADLMLPHFGELVKQLDERRLGALKAKSRERALLAALISRRASMTEAFAHAYVSSMVRAGEALGHDELFEAVQHEESATSTMIPYDIFSDETGAWEDPCREKSGFTPNLTGDDLFRRAHARAMIQKSLKKLQDRHNIRGAAPNAGPYADPPPPSSGASNSGSSTSVAESKTDPRSIQRTNSGLRRRGSHLSADVPASAGSGSAAATSMALYRPNHYSAPLIWDCDDIENLPYGRHASGPRKRSLSVTAGFGTRAYDGRKRSKNSRTSRSMSVSLPSSASSIDDGVLDNSGVKRSTDEIDWAEVADVFEPVSISRASTPTAKRVVEHAVVVPGQTIIAPFCQKIESFPQSSGEDSSDEEDLSDAAVLARHRIVLDEMKKKLEKFMAARKKALQRGARRSSSSIK